MITNLKGHNRPILFSRFVAIRVRVIFIGPTFMGYNEYTLYDTFM